MYSRGPGVQSGVNISMACAATPNTKMQMYPRSILRGETSDPVTVSCVAERMAHRDILVVIYAVAIRAYAALAQTIVAKAIGHTTPDVFCPSSWDGPTQYSEWTTASSAQFRPDDFVCTFPHGCPLGGSFLDSSVCEAPPTVFSPETAHRYCCGFTPDTCSVACNDPIRNHTACAVPWTQETCSYHGTCVNGQCMCHNGYQGPRCESLVPCDAYYRKEERPCEGGCMQSSGTKLTLYHPTNNAPPHCAFTMTHEDCAPEPCHETPKNGTFVYPDTLAESWTTALKTSGTLNDFIRVDEIIHTWRNMSANDTELRAFLGDVIRQRIREGPYLDEQTVQSMVDHAFRTTTTNIGKLRAETIDSDCQYSAFEVVSACSHLDCDADIKVESREVVSGSETLCNDIWRFSECPLDASCLTDCFFSDWSEWTPCPDPAECLPVPHFRTRSLWKYDAAAECALELKDGSDPEWDPADAVAPIQNASEPIEFDSPYKNFRVVAKMCPIADTCSDCTTTQWSEWSGCPLATNCTRNVTEFRTRGLMNLHEKCADTPLIEYRPCPPVDETCDQCHMGDWGPWTDCPDPDWCLAGSIRFRERKIISTPTNWLHANAPCPPTLDKAWCPIAPECDEFPIGCGPIQEQGWSEWSPCPSIPCSGYVQTRVGKAWRNNTGVLCDVQTETRPCRYFHEGAEITGTKCDECPAQDGGDSTIWTDWDECPSNIGCANVTRTRLRLDLNWRGKVCDAETETELCPTPSYCDECIMSDWGEWTACPENPCQPGTQIRKRSVLWAGDWDCPNEVESRQCAIAPSCAGSAECTNKTAWRNVGPCVGDCERGGKQLRLQQTFREDDGNLCDEEWDYEHCEPLEWECAAGCEISDYDWSQCYGGCGEGVRVGNATLLKPRPNCNKPLVKTEPCDTGIECDPLKICEVTDWTDWTPCLVSPSGANRQFRFRHINHTGAACPALVEDRPCHETFTTDGVNATVSYPECVLGEWADAGKCVNGYQLQTRKLIMPGENCEIPARHVKCSSFDSSSLVTAAIASLAVIISIVGCFVQPPYKYQSLETGTLLADNNNMPNQEASDLGSDTVTSESEEEDRPLTTARIRGAPLSSDYARRRRRRRRQYKLKQ